MAQTLRRPQPAWLLLAALALLALCAPAAAQEPARGKVRKEVYAAPFDRFTLPVRKGKQVTDAHTAQGGSVSVWSSYLDNEGFLYAIGADSAGDPEAFREWMRETVMPTVFCNVSPAARLLADSAGTFAGQPALFVLIDFPGGGVAETTELVEGAVKRGRADSRRVGVVLQRGTWRLLVFTETNTFFGQSAEPQGDWMRYSAALLRFWQSVRFGG